MLQIVHGELKYRQEPYEWVYDGLHPLLLDSVLKSREGIHISLAALYCALGRRLGCTILPEIVSLGESALDHYLSQIHSILGPAMSCCLPVS